MFECQICGLLSLGGSSCPACGSQLRTDLTEISPDDEILLTDVPGLDEAAEAWYDLEGIEPPQDGEISSGETSDEPSSGALPFGFQGESNVYAPRLPFGIGSYAEGVPFDSAGRTDVDMMKEELLTVEAQSRTEHMTGSEPSAPSGSHVQPLSSTPAPSTPTGSQRHDGSTERVSRDAVVPATIQTGTSQDDVFVPTPALESQHGSEFSSEVPTGLVSQSLNPTPVQRSSTAVKENSTPPPAPIPEVVQEPVRITSARLIEPEPVSSVLDVPDYWRIDANIPNYEEIYDTSEAVVEVQHDHESVDVVVYNHETDSPVAVFHSPLEASPAASLQPSIHLALHPAQALMVDTMGDEALQATLATAFTSLQGNDWSSAARYFQSMAARLPGSAEVFNNYGIALLQRALGMRQSPDGQQQQLAEAQFESSILALREAAKMAPTNGDILVNLSVALIESGRAEKALGIMNVHNTRSPGDVKGMNTAAVAMFKLGQVSQAVDVLRQVSGDSIAGANLGILSPQRG